MFRDRHFNRNGRWHRETGSGADTTAPTIGGVTETPGSTTALISWSLSEPADGYVEYGTTTGYGSQTTYEANLLTYHAQTLTGLTTGTTYYYRIVSRDASDNGATYEDSFTTSGTTPTPNFFTFGPGVIARAKGNLEVHNPGGHGQGVACRFVAENGGTPRYITVQWKSLLSSGYGGGDGGLYRIGVQTLDSERKPSGTWVAYRDNVAPGIFNDGYGFRVEMTTASELTAGVGYAVVFLNVHADPEDNYGSWNCPWKPDVDTPIQPRYPDDEMAMLTGDPPTWAVNTSHIASFDLEYTDGDHEGIAAVQGQDWLYNPSVVGIVNSGSTARWSFTYPATYDSITVDAVNFYLQKSSGSTDATVDVKIGGVSQATGTFTTSSDLVAEDREWCRAALSGNVTIDPGDVVEVFVAAASGEYRLPLMLWGINTTGTYMRSWPYTEGGGNIIHRADDGATGTTPCWSARYAHTTFGCYFELA